MGSSSELNNDQSINRNERKFLKESLLANEDFINRRNARKRLDEFIDTLQVKHLESGDKLFSFGDKSDEIFIIGHGLISIIAEDGHDLGNQGHGAIIGSYGFFNNKTRSAHAKALKPSKLFFMDVKTYNSIMFTRVAGPEDLSKFDLFYSLTDDVKKQLYPKLQTEFYNKEEIICKEGSPFTCIHLVTNGSVTKSSKSMPHAEIIDKNKNWGSSALKKNSKVHLATYTAAEPSTVIKINLNDFKTLMPQVYQSFLQGSAVDLSEIRLADKRTAAMEKRRSSISKKI